MASSHLPYVITEAYCAAFAATVWYRLNTSLGSEHEVRQLRNMIYCYLVMLVTDILWALTEDGLLDPPRLLNAAYNAVTIMAVTGGCYFWFRFIEDRLHFAAGRKKLLDTLMMVPLFLICALDLISVFTGWIFYIDADNCYQTSPLFWLQGVVNYIYLLIPTVYSICRAVRTRSRQDRAEYWTYSLYMIAPLLSGQLEDTFPGVPLLALNIFLMILILFLMIQNMQVYNDALTGLNNRRRLNKYLEECLPKSADRPVLLFIMDIDSFKSINDTWGHLEGDSALKTFSQVLRQVAAHYYGFIARYGGDEFCMVIEAAGRTPELVTEDIRRTLAAARDARRPYELTVSIGCAACAGEERSTEAALARADAALYEDKKKWHALHD